VNERIQELSEQAEKYADDNFRGEPTWSEAFESKFAELIVRECIDTVKRRYMGDNNREDMEVRRCVEDLKTHFGVE
jgi:hypothetical protein